MPRVLAAAMGPGVGGIKTWEMYRPADSATVMATLEVPVRRTRARRMGSRITKPLSQNTGMETTQPMSSMASSGFFLPTILMTISASFRAAPVFSRMLPISAPRMITIPMELKVPEKPAPMTPGISVSEMPASSARSNDTVMMEMNGWILYFEIATIITTIARTKTIIKGRPVIFCSSCYHRFEQIVQAFACNPLLCCKYYTTFFGKQLCF